MERRLIYRKVGTVEAWMSSVHGGIEVVIYDASTAQWQRTLVTSFSLAYRMVIDAAMHGASQLVEKKRG